MSSLIDKIKFQVAGVEEELKNIDEILSLVFDSLETINYRRNELLEIIKLHKMRKVHFEKQLEDLLKSDLLKVIQDDTLQS